MLWPSFTSSTLCLSWRRWKSSGKVVYCGQVFKKSTLRVKNFVTWLYYVSGSGTHNIYWEDQALNLGPLDPDHDDKRRLQPASAHQQPSSSTTPRPSSHCPAWSQVVKISHASPPKDTTPSFTLKASSCLGLPKTTRWENQKREREREIMQLSQILYS